MIASLLGGGDVEAVAKSVENSGAHIDRDAVPCTVDVEHYVPLTLVHDRVDAISVGMGDLRAVGCALSIPVSDPIQSFSGGIADIERNIHPQLRQRCPNRKIA